MDDLISISVICSVKNKNLLIEIDDNGSELSIGNTVIAYYEKDTIFDTIIDLEPEAHIIVYNLMKELHDKYPRQNIIFDVAEIIIIAKEIYSYLEVPDTTCVLI